MALIAMAIAAAARQKHEGICSRLAPSLRGGELECPAGAKAAEGQGHHRSCPASGGGRGGAPGGRSSSEEQHGCRKEAKSESCGVRQWRETARRLGRHYFFIQHIA